MKSKNSLNVSVIQLNSQNDINKNIVKAKILINESLKNRPDLICLPEMFHCRGNVLEMLASADTIPGTILSHFMDLAKKHNVFILAGSICEKTTEKRKVYNSSVLINNMGEVQAKYRKIHLFKVNFNDVSIDESITFKPGKKPVSTSIDNFKLGLSICYDLRFPELYRIYNNNGVNILTVPASFTKPTGEAHWETLLRARAIENQAYVIAPNQTGNGAGNVPTYGNSMIIDPWGTVLARASEDKEEIISATLSLEDLSQVREKLPSLQHRVL